MLLEWGVFSTDREAKGNINEAKHSGNTLHGNKIYTDGSSFQVSGGFDQFFQAQ